LSRCSVNENVKTLLVHDQALLDDKYFPEFQVEESWFELNCFKCSCRNITRFLLLLIIILGVGGYFSWKYWDIIKPDLLSYLKLASIPVICVAFTYGHIWLALWMTFYPLKFIGCCQQKRGFFAGFGFGWQGIVPNRANIMAEIAIDLLVPHVIKVEDVIENLDPMYISEITRELVTLVLQDIVPEVGTLFFPNLWPLLPNAIKQSVIQKGIDDGPIAIRAMFEDLKINIHDVFDLKDMAQRSLEEEPALLNDIFLTCGRKEFVFIKNTGAMLGLIAGLLQMFATMYIHGYWFNMLMLPISGFILGWATNWIAIKLIFRPIEPWNLGCCTIQGLFLKRQRIVSYELSKVMTQRVVHARTITKAMLHGKSSNKLFALIQRHIEEACDRITKMDKLAPLISVVIAESDFEILKAEVVERVFTAHEKFYGEFEKVNAELCDYADNVMDLRETFKQKLIELPPEEFERVLHPVFEADEIKLIVLGGLLGLAVGTFQVFVIGN